MAEGDKPTPLSASRPILPSAPTKFVELGLDVVHILDTKAKGQLQPATYIS